MTDISKYRNVSLTHETYKTLISLSKVLLPDATLSISKTIESIANEKAKKSAAIANLNEPLTIGSVVASDAFFPFPDGLIAAADAGVTAVIQPGGSIKDKDVIAAADERGLVMVFTSIRHFKH